MLDLDRTRVIAAQEFRLVASDPLPVIAMAVTPLLFISFLTPFFDTYLRSQGVPDANGALVALPAMASLFGFLLVESFGVRMFQDLENDVWRRSLAGYATVPELLLGRTFRWFAHLVLNSLVLFAIVVVVYDVHLDVNVPALVVVLILSCLCALSFGAMAFALAPNLAIFDAMTFGGGLVLGGIGGAFTPPALLPSWIRAIDWISPIYWIVDLYRSVLLEQADLGDIAREVGIVAGFIALFTAVAMARFEPLTSRRAM